MNIKYRILYIDDEIKAYEALKNFAHSFNAKLIYSNKLSEGIQKLKSSIPYHGIILDARCSLLDNGIRKDSFLEEALEKIKEIAKNKNCYFPIIIYSGFPEKFKSIYGEKYKFFEKDRDNPKDLFKTLIKEIKNSNHTKIEVEYKEVFEIFNKGYLPHTIKQELLLLIEEKNDNIRIKQNLTYIRNIFEEIIHKIFEEDNSIIPNPNENTKPSLINILGGYRSGKMWEPKMACVWSVLLEKFGYSIWDLCSKYGKHGKIKDFDKIYPASIYTVQSLLFSLFDILIWLKKYIEAKESVTWRRIKLNDNR